MNKLNTSVMVGNVNFPNRLVKSAMSEGLCPHGLVTPALISLYEQWARGGLKCSITGNVMVDARFKNEPGVVVIEDERDLDQLQKWANLSQKYNMVQIVQLSHPGKQAPRGLNQYNVAPSAIGFDKEMSATFPVPRELTGTEIVDIINRFGEAARVCEKAGFQGVQIHGAHGYLISQFLSPRHNQRQDEWGGDIQNRMRFLVEIYRRIREQTSPQFVVGVKINSADFQKGGFTEFECKQVLQTLETLGIDFVEISGGTYEAPAMVVTKKSTQVREAYFLDFAADCTQIFSKPILVTGGFRNFDTMNNALIDNKAQLIGLARPFAVQVDVAQQVVLFEQNCKYATKPIKTGVPFIDKMGVMEIIWYAAQFKTISQRKQPNPNLPPLKVFLGYSKKTIQEILKGGVAVWRRRSN